MRKFKQNAKRILSVALSAALIVEMGGYAPQTQAAAESGYQYLEAATMPEEIQNADSFYVGTTSADLKEDAAGPYLLKIGRGGSATEPASVTVKIADATASYGKDYNVYEFVSGEEGKEAYSPEDNRSLLDIIEDNDVIEEELTGTDDADSAKEAEEKSAVDYYEKVMDDKEKNEADNNPLEKAVAKEEPGDYATNPLAQAKEKMTGDKSDREVMTSAKQDMVDYLSDVGNYITEMVPGAALKLDFAKGETEKYVAIAPVDNDEKDGKRTFYMVLSDPSEGMTNSTVSESIFTIVDDEPSENASISFSAASYTAKDGQVEIKLLRTGNMSETVQVKMESSAGTAVSGRDFSPVNAEVTFPFGIKERTLKIGIDNQYLYKDADFTLKLKKSAGAAPGETAKAVVTIPAPKKNTEESLDDEDECTVVSTSSLYDDYVRAGDIMNDSSHVKVRGDGSSWMAGGNLHQKVDDTWVDDKFYLSGTNRNERMWIYDGFRLSWTKSSGKSSWSSSNISYYCTSGDYDRKIFIDTGDEPRFNWRETSDYFFGDTDAAAVKIYSKNWGGKQNETEVDWITPIKRVFLVTQKAPDTLSFFNGTSTKQADGNAAKASLVNQVSGQDYAIKHSDEKIVLQSNVCNGKGRLTGAKIWDSSKKNSRDIDTRFLNGFKAGDQAIQITLNNDFCNTYRDYIKYDEYSSNRGTRIKGNIIVQPVFGYNDATVRFEERSADFTGGVKVNATVKINGSNINYAKNYTYHKGDVLTMSATSSNNQYECLGMEYYYYDENLRRDMHDKRYFDKGQLVFTIDTSKNYKFVPIIVKKENKITVRVPAADKNKFMAEGMFDPTFFNSHSTLSVDKNYYDITVADDNMTVQGQTYTLAAETSSSSYVPVWLDSNSSKYFVGSSHQFKAQDVKENNIIRLYAGTASSNYVAFKGKLYYQNFSILSKVKNNGVGDPILPAEGGFVSVGGQLSIAEGDGGFQTNAFRYVRSITNEAKKTVTFEPNSGSGQPLYFQAQLGASGASEVKEIAYTPKTGSKATVSDGTNNVSSYICDMSNVTIRTNDASQGSPVFTNIYTSTKNTSATEGVYMSGEMTTITVTVPDTSTEHVKSVKFYIYDSKTNEIKCTMPASKVAGQTGNWSASKIFEAAGSDEYAESDRIYVQMITDKAPELIETVDTKNMSQSAKDAIKQTIYAPVNTGYTLIRAFEYADPTTQKVNIGTMEGMGGLPLLNNFNGNMNLGPVQLGIENLYDDKGNVVGTRIKVGAALDFEKTSFARSDGYETADDGVDYGSKIHILDNLKSSYKTAFKNALKGDKSRNMSSFGGSNWGVYPIIGFYMDFAIKTKTNGAGEVLDQHLEVQGGGIYVGAAANYSIAWYALIPVVFIPCYFGVSGSLKITLQAGATTNVKEETKEEQMDEFIGVSHNLTEELNFDFQLSVMATIQVYCGVGVCGTLGVRGGMQVDANFLWYPTLAAHNSYFDPVGLTIGVSFKLWVDLLLFTIPIPVYTLKDFNWGLNEQYEELKDKNKDDLKELLEKYEKKDNKPKNAADTPDNKDEGENEIKYEVKPMNHKPSEWAGNVGYTSPDEVKTMATYKEKNNKVIQADGYDDPAAKLMDMGEYGTLLVFLQKDYSRTAEEQTAISYSVYKNGMYSDPVIIQTDGTADFQPNICEAGNDMIITWISSDPDIDKGDPSNDDYQKKYVTLQEVYSVKVPKADLAEGKHIEQDSISKLTNDRWYDSYPFAIYDNVTGDYNVYYVASAEATEGGAEAVDFANPMSTSKKTYSAICYRVYNNALSDWDVTSFAKDEKPSKTTDEEYMEQLEEYGGQRFLSSPIKDEDVDMEDPLIADLTGIAYNGTGIYAYTIDKDNSADTDEDRDLFVQFYRFGSRKTYVPVRITDDDVADSMPQIIRKGGETGGTTYLFWKSGDTLKYIDLTRLVKYGIDNNGKIKASALAEGSTEAVQQGEHDEFDSSLTETQQEAQDYKFTIEQVEPYGAEDNQYASFSQYQVAVDKKDNLYVVYVDNGSDVEKGESATQDIFATALIDTEVANSAIDNSEDTEIINDDPSFDIPETREDRVKKWSMSNQLTDSGEYCDHPAVAISSDGNMIMVYNSYDLITEKTGKIDGEGNEEQKVELTDLKFMAGTLEPYGAVEATEIELSDKTPVDEEEVTAKVTFKNTGLTAATDGFTAKVVLKDAKGGTKDIDTYTYEGSLVPADYVNVEFSFVADENMTGSCIEVKTTETNLQGTCINESESFVKKAEYEVVSNNSYQGADSKFYSEVEVKNVGNDSTAEGDKIRIDFAGPYAEASAFGIEESVLASDDISLEPGETKSYTFELNVPASAFNYYGRIRTKAVAVDKDGKEYDDVSEDDLYMYLPAELSLNGGNTINMKQDETKELKALEFVYTTIDNLSEITPKYMSDDTSVVMIDDGKLIAVGEGTANVTAYAYPYDSSATISVVVEGKEIEFDPDPTNVPTPQPTEVPKPTADLSGTKVLYGEGTVYYDEITGTVTGTNVKGLLIPLGVTVPRGAPVDITVSGSASTSMRGWLSDGAEQRMSEITDSFKFNQKYTLVAEPFESGDTADHLQIKGPSYDSTFSSITISKVVVEYDPSKAPTPSPEPTAKPSKPPTATPKVTDAPTATPNVTDTPVVTADPNANLSPGTSTTATTSAATATAAPGTVTPTDSGTPVGTGTAKKTTKKGKDKINGKNKVKVGKFIKLTAKFVTAKGIVKWKVNKSKLAYYVRTKKSAVIKLYGKKAGKVTVTASIGKTKIKRKITVIK